MRIDGDGGRSNLHDPVVVLLHGFMGSPEDLAPFARSLGVRAEFFFPQGHVDLRDRGLRGRAWWPEDADTKLRAAGPSADLSGWIPDGLSDARSWLEDILDEVKGATDPRPLVLGGFSQGAMLACDLVLRSARAVDGLVL